MVTARTDRLLSVWDFRSFHISYGDSLHYQQVSLIEREKAGVDKIDIVWLVFPDQMRWDKGLTAEARDFHLHRLIAISRVNQHLGSFSILDSPTDSEIHQLFDRYAHTFPSRALTGPNHPVYTENFGRIKSFYAEKGFIPRLSCKPGIRGWAREFMSRTAGDNVFPIAVQLRNRAVWDPKGSPIRNANLNEWQQFFQACATRYPDVRFIVLCHPVELNPHMLHIGAMPNVILTQQFGTDAELDCAIIQEAMAFLSTPSGLASMAILGEKPFLIFNMMRDGRGDTPHGMERLPWGTELQRFIWRPESSGRLLQEFERLFYQLTAWRPAESRGSEEAVNWAR